MQTQIVAKELIYYDKYEYEFGDGFYPTIEQYNPCNESDYVSFTYNKNYNCWVQTDGINICGLDGNNGINLLNIINKKHNLNCIKIKNRIYSDIYPKK
jgi:hypothetical protein